jgi:hypothetical protein
LRNLTIERPPKIVGDNERLPGDIELLLLVVLEKEIIL